MPKPTETKEERLFRLRYLFDTVLATLLKVSLLVAVSIYTSLSGAGTTLPFAFFIFLLFEAVVSLISAIAATKLYGPARNTRLFIYNRAANIFAAAVASSLLVEIILQMMRSGQMLILLLGLPLFVFARALIAPLYFKNVTNIFNRIEPRKDLELRYAGRMAELGISAKILHMRDTFFGVCSAAAILTTNEIILFGRVEELFSDKELDAVVMHELVHLRQRWWLLKRTISSFILFLLIVIAIVIPMEYRLIPLPQAIVYALFSVIAVSVLTIILLLRARKLMRDFERKADKGATSFDAEAYRSAMRKLYASGKMPRKFGFRVLNAHPEFEERVRRG